MFIEIVEIAAAVLLCQIMTTIPLPDAAALAAARVTSERLAAERAAPATMPGLPPRQPTAAERMLADLARDEERRRAEQARQQLETENARQEAARAHAEAAAQAGIEPGLSPSDPGQARHYVQARAFRLLPAALDTLEAALRGDAKAGSYKLALEIVERAIGPASRPNSIGVDLSKLPPSEAVEHVLSQVAQGRIDPAFGNALIDTLRQRAKARQVDAIVKGATNG